MQREVPTSEGTADGRVEPKRHWPALDGLRAVAVLAVIFYHVGSFPGGYLGVDVFFVLSGFLITSLLLTEWDARGGRVSFRDFYARRVLRLFPALGCVLVTTLLVVAVLALTGRHADRAFAWTTLSAVPWVIGFVGNWARALAPHAPIGTLGALGQTWSLAVEEQFYLVWPALFVLLLRRRIRRDRLALALILLAVAEMIYRAWMANRGISLARIYYATDSHSDGLLVGCALAFWLVKGPGTGDAAGRIAKPMTWLAAASLAALFVVGRRAGAPVETSAAVLATGVLTAAIVTGGAPPALLRVLSARAVVRMGRRSYGLYLWQYLMLAVTEELCARYAGLSPAGPWPGRLIFATAMAGGVVASFVLAELSYVRVELPALRLKRFFRWSRPSPVPVVSRRMTIP